MKRTLIFSLTGLLLIVLVTILYLSLESNVANNSTGLNASSSSRTNSLSNEQGSRIDSMTYTTTYDGKEYDKEALVYVPDSYETGKPMNILYLMHGSGMSAEQVAEDIKPLLDESIANGDIEPLLVVFPTYYPDRSFVVSNYSADYPLNHYFAETEVLEVMKTVESQYTTFAETTDETGFTASRSHRAFGGYSMGGITTWDVLVEQSDKFFYYMPMAGDSWIGQVTGRNSDEVIAETLVSGLQENNYGKDDFQIIAMVGGSDGTKYSMIPQIEALRSNHSDLITDDNLIYWENKGGGHNQESFELETEHGLTYLFQE